ncbi:flagellar hook-length control protein FliK [Fredinandcohnia onubensis]|uniref:flagellar hook-length control protein FliK n=1 Tax=Fredinandcohnia onubensis TaxID=1571209 RepID=UPI00211E3249|nr:flagellar hook-length control protein FliK [Fredinandcohnia onubensis]
MVVNLGPSTGAVRKAVNSSLGYGLLQGNSTLQLSFREKLDAITEGAPKIFVDSKLNHTPSFGAVNEEDSSSMDSTNQVLSEFQSFIKDEFDLAVLEDVFRTLPSNLVDQIKGFITAIQNGEIKLEIGQAYGEAEQSALLLVASRLVEDNPVINKAELLNLLKQMKIASNEELTKSPQVSKEPTDLKSIKLIQELMQSLENKTSLVEKPLTESQSRLQYLQTVHSRYFAAPKGIETTQAFTAGKLMQKASTHQVIGTSSEAISVVDVSSNQPSKVEQFTLFVEQTSKPLPNQQQFIKQFQNILARSNFLNSGGQQKLLINLYPEHLGSLRIEILQSEAGMIARILASTSQAKELVESQLSNLKHSFLAQNISVEKIEVSTQLQYQTERNLQRENEQQGQQSGRQQKQQDNQEPNEDVSFTTALLDELVNIKV